MIPAILVLAIAAAWRNDGLKEQFPGGLFAVVCRTSGEDLTDAVNGLKEGVQKSGGFSEDDSDDPYRRAILSHIVTPKSVQDRYDFDQMDLFLPIKVS